MNVLYIKKVRLKDKSTLSKFLYVILHILVGGFVGIWYFSGFHYSPACRHRCMVIHLSGCLAAWY